MNSVDVRIGSRLKAVRESLGLTLEDVCSRVGFESTPILFRIEKGERPARVSELTKLCKIYCRDLSYFVSEDEPQEPSISFAWRDRTPEKDMRAIEAKATDLFFNYYLLESLMEQSHQPKVNPWESTPDFFTSEEVQQKAEEITKELNLGPRPGLCLARIMEEDLNIKITFYDLDGYASAAVASGDFGFGVMVDAHEAPWRRIYNLAHELFHIYASSKYPLERLSEYESAPDNQVERLAEDFAAALLMPTDSIISEYEKLKSKKRIVTLDLIQLALDFGVSTQALILRLSYLLGWDKRNVRERLEAPEFKYQNKAARTELNKPELKYSQRFVGLGLKALSEGRISKSKFCKIFEISRSAFPRFLQERGFDDSIIGAGELEFSN